MSSFSQTENPHNPQDPDRERRRQKPGTPKHVPWGHVLAFSSKIFYGENIDKNNINLKRMGKEYNFDGKYFLKILSS